MMAFEYRNIFISVAEDCPADVAETPPAFYRGKPTIAAQEFEMLRGHDFELTMSEVLSSVWITRKGGEGQSADEHDVLRNAYFNVGRACFRASPLAKRYGWGFVFDADGRVALVPCDSERYAKLRADPNLEQLAAMRSSRK